jgi:integrase
MLLSLLSHGENAHPTRGRNKFLRDRLKCSHCAAITGWSAIVTTLRCASSMKRSIALPAGAPLKALLDTAERRGPLILTNTRGIAWTSDGFRSSWAKVCDQAGISDLTFHDLRGTAVVRLAIAGASVPQIAAVTGHSLKDVEAILDAHYLGRDIQLAEEAVLKLEARTKL